MNATDDGLEPIGEAPEVTMPQVVDAITRQVQVLGEIRALHRRVVTDAYSAYCWECRDVTGRRVLWPCETMRIVERVAL